MYDWNKLPRKDVVPSWIIFKEQTESQIYDLKVYQDAMDDESLRTQIIHESWNDTFAHFFRTTFLIQTYTVLEHNLRRVCLNVERFNYQKFSISDLGGSSDLQKANVYLKKTIGFDIGNLKQWNIITDCQALRNSIVHSNCYYKEGEKVEKLLDKYECLKIDSVYQDMKLMKKISSFVITNDSLNKEFLNAVDKLFQQLYSFIIDFNDSTPS